MRVNLLLAILLISQANTHSAQEYFVSQDQSNFFEWFHERSQVDQLYADRSTLYTFTDQVNVRQKPSTQSNILTQLPIGWAVTNIAYRENDLPKASINGYEDIWYHIRGNDEQGKSFVGYVWGGHIAKGWREADLTGDGKLEFVMLGVAGKSRTNPQDINAEIRIVQSNRLMSQTLVPQLCVFEECASSAMLRVLQSQKVQGLMVIEASTMTIGCSTGIDKAFYYWNGSGLVRVYQAEYASKTEIFRKKFTVATPGKQVSNVQLCEYGGEDSGYNPIWNCKTLQIVPASETKPIAVSNKKQFIEN
ncbi:MAG: SH3 domain-containing protein [Saprospiraceae bacterium]|nr:SH3 domain-containing protein [Saprospiraceae bacterium]